jgi:hypothetical protein
MFDLITWSRVDPKWMKNFTGRPFFSLFFIARANQKNPNLALGRQSSTGAFCRTKASIM